jgi:hypothetical protein
MYFKKINLYRRSKAWKQYVEHALLQHANQFEKVNEAHRILLAQHETLAAEHENLKSVLKTICAQVLSQLIPDNTWFGKNEQYCYAQRGTWLRILRISMDSYPRNCLVVQGHEFFTKLLLPGRIDTIEAALLNDDGSISRWEPQPWLLDALREQPAIFGAGLSLLQMPHVLKSKASSSDAAETFFEDALALLRTNPELIDFVANALPIQILRSAGAAPMSPPFDEPDTLPPFSKPAEPKRNSVVFVNNSYYHFNTLAEALRRRGWVALTVSTEPRDSPQRQFYVGEDLNLYHEDPITRRRQIREFLRTVPERFGALHFYGRGYATFFSENVESSARRTKVPWDFLELRRHNIAIGYMPSGCVDGALQSSIRRVSQNVCERCVWESRPEVCSDAKNGAWADTLDVVCDWIGLEGDFATHERMGPKFVLGPVVTALDPSYWCPDLIVDDAKLVPRETGELLVYHSFGNVKVRRVGGRDIKGSAAVEAAIKKLRDEGIPLKLFFATDLPITEVRWYKVQADIVIDQLNYGRIGANARESFMMGKPIITRLISKQQSPLPPLRSVVEAPALDASETTIEAVLRRLALNPEMRKEMSQRSRDYALRWYSADACARRYEMVVDRVKRGLVPDADELYPQSLQSAVVG